VLTCVSLPFAPLVPQAFRDGLPGGQATHVLMPDAEYQIITPRLLPSRTARDLI
jgi:hypothetical protein